MTEQTAAAIRIDGTRLRDRHGREVILRGVNLGGDTKLPYPDGGTHIPTDFADHRTVSFVGRPFPLDEADAHFRRLRRWGFNCLRLLTTWEAVEHAGPGLYDTAYLDYLTAIAARAGTHGSWISTRTSGAACRAARARPAGPSTPSAWISRASPRPTRRS